MRPLFAASICFLLLSCGDEPAGIENSTPTAADVAATTQTPEPVEIELTGLDPDGDALTFHIVEPPPGGEVSTPVSTGPTSATVTYTPAPATLGEDIFTYVVRDESAVSAPATVRVTVTGLSPNVAPSFLIGADVTDSPGAGAHSIPGWITAISAGPSSESGQALSFVVSNDNNGLFAVQPTIAPDGTLSYTPAATGTGSSTLTVSLSDDGGTENGGVDTSADQTATATLTFTTWIANSGSSDVSLVDVFAGMATGSIGVGFNPLDVALTPDGGTAYVANVSSHTVSVIDVATGTETNTIAVGLSPVWVDFTTDGSTAFVANRSDDNVSVIDVATETVTGTIPVGENPLSVAFTPDGGIAYVANRNDSTVSVIDVTSRTVTSTIPVGEGPVAVATTPDGTAAWVTNLFSGDISVIDVATAAVTDTIPIGTTDLPSSVAFTPDGGTAYVTSQGVNMVSVIDVAAGLVTGIIPVGDTPVAVAFTPDGTAAYVANVSSDNVPEIDVATGVVTSTIPVGALPNSVAISRVRR